MDILRKGEKLRRQSCIESIMEEHGIISRRGKEREEGTTGPAKANHACIPTKSGEYVQYSTGRIAFSERR